MWRQQLLETRLQAYKEDLSSWLTGVAWKNNVTDTQVEVTGIIVEVNSFMDDLRKE